MKKSHLRLIITFALSIIFVFLTLGCYQTSLSENPKDKEITLVLAGKYKIKPEKRERFLELAKPGFEETSKEPGNVSYTLYEEFDNPNTFLYFEEWVNREALNSHLKQPYITPLIKEIPELLAEDAEVRVYDINNLSFGLE